MKIGLMKLVICNDNFFGFVTESNRSIKLEITEKR